MDEQDQSPRIALNPLARTGKRAPERQTSRLWSAPFVIITLTSFTLFVVGQGLNGGLSVYVERIGEAAAFTGMLSAVFSVSAAIARLTLGRVIDLRGRMIIAVIGAFVLACGTLLAALVVNNVALVIARIIQGAGFAAATTAAATAAADTLPPSRMGEGIGYFGLGQAVAMSFGPALALAILNTDPPQNLFFVLTATAAIACILAASCRYERRPELLPDDAVYRRRQEERARQSAESAARSAANPASEERTEMRGGMRGLHAVFEVRALPGALPMLFMSAAVGFAISFVGLYGERLGMANAGLFFTLSAVSMILVRVKSKSFMDVTLPITIYAVTIASGIVSFGMLLAAPHAPALFYSAGLFYGVFLALGTTVNQSVAVKNTPPDRWGATNALVLLANDIGIGGASLIWGIVNDTLGFSASIIGALGCMAVSFALACIAYPREAKRR